MDAHRRIEELNEVFGALSHPARRQILMTIWFRGGEMTSGEIAARFAHSWPTTTRHLRVLEAAELIVAEKNGRERAYRVNREKLRSIDSWMGWFDKEP